MFISYRHADGAEQAEVLSTYLRTGGIVPWFDGSDLAGGLVAHNVRSAIEEGISAGVLLVTPTVGESEFVRNVELPLLVTQDARAVAAAVSGEPRDFRLYVLHALGADAVSDPDEADRLLGTDDPGRAALLGGERLRDRLQYAQRELGRLLTDLLRRRLEARHQDLADRQVTVWLQTRPVPYVDRYVRAPFDVSIDLSVRLRQDPSSNIPRELDYRCFQLTLPLLADAIWAAVLPQRTDSAGVVLPPKVTIAGGGHPSIMWALGSALPEARHAFGTVEVQDIRREGATQRSVVWSEDARPAGGARYRVVEKWYSGTPALGAQGAPRRLAVLLSGTRVRNLALIEALRDRLEGCWQALDLRVALEEGAQPRADDAPRDFFPADEGAGLAEAFATRLRALHLDSGFELHVASSLPVAVVLQIARRCNKVPVIFYELAKVDGGEQYRAVLRTDPGSANGPITDVYPHRAPVVPADGTALVNLTPHDVTLFDGGTPVRTWPAPETVEGRSLWVRRDDSRRSAGRVTLDDGLSAPVSDLAAGPLTNVPEVTPGTWYIVPRISAEAARRSDFVFPDDEVRDEEGRIIGCRGFARFPSTDAERLLRTLIPAQEAPNG